MKIRQILYVTLSFLAVNLGIGSYIVAASASELKVTSQEISGTDSASGVAFHASLVAGDRVVIDLYFGTKRIHADLGYARGGIIKIRSVYQANGLPATLSVQDIIAFQKLRMSLTPKINHASQHGRALSRLVNLIASTPDGFTFNFNSGSFTNESFTSICPKIGEPGLATFMLGKKLKKTYHYEVTVGPVCYQKPALGRCGNGGGYAPIVGLAQPFTQECLNHDECCEKTGDRFFGPFNVCGHAGTTECEPEFRAAIPGFFEAPDCGNTGGNWIDSNGLTYALSDADSNGDPMPFAGFLNATSPFCPSVWSVAGTRTGTQISFTATNPSPPLAILRSVLFRYRHLCPTCWHQPAPIQ